MRQVGGGGMCGDGEIFGHGWGIQGPGVPGREMARDSRCLIFSFLEKGDRSTRHFRRNYLATLLASGHRRLPIRELGDRQMVFVATMDPFHHGIDMRSSEQALFATDSD